jgi:transcriptional regulator with XRE-family HTH domain
MTISLSKKLEQMPADRQRKIEARAAELIAEEMSLQELRKAMGKTQAKVAAELGVGQDSIARYEQRTDMLLSTLSDYVSKVGGTLELTAKFPNRNPVRIIGFGALSSKASKRAATRPIAAARVNASRKSPSVAKRATKTKVPRKASAALVR